MEYIGNRIQFTVGLKKTKKQMIKNEIIPNFRNLFKTTTEAILVKEKKEKVKMRGVINRLGRALYFAAAARTSGSAAAAAASKYPSNSLFARTLTYICSSTTQSHPSDKIHAGTLLTSPWSATQLRHARFTGADVRFIFLLFLCFLLSLGFHGKISL